MGIIINWKNFVSSLKVFVTMLVMFVTLNQSIYGARLDCSGMFDNTIKEAYPQTIVAELVEAHFNAPLPQGKTVKKCYIIGFDGARCDGVTVLKDAQQSGIKMIAQQGGLYTAYCGGDDFLFDKQSTSTAPGWASILTGEWAGVHKVYDNGDIKSNESLTVLTRMVETGKAGSAVFKCAYPGHLVSDDATYKDEAAYTQLHNVGVRWETYSGDDTLQAALMDEVKSPSCADIIFSIYERPDAAGHGYNFNINVPEYAQAMELCDKDAYDLITAIQGRESYAAEDWLLIITSDHGGMFNGHGTRTTGCRATFIAANKAIDTAG